MREYGTGWDDSRVEAGTDVCYQRAIGLITSNKPHSEYAYRIHHPSQARSMGTHTCTPRGPGRTPGRAHENKLSKSQSETLENSRLLNHTLSRCDQGGLLTYYEHVIFFYLFPFDCYSGPAPVLPGSPATRPVPLPCGVHPHTHRYIQLKTL